MLGSKVFKQETKPKWESFNNKSELGLNPLYLEIRLRGVQTKEMTLTNWESSEGITPTNTPTCVLLAFRYL